MRRHLRHLNRVDSSHRRQGLSFGRRAREGREQLLGGDVGGVQRRDGLSPSLGRDEFGRVGALGRGEPGRGEPRFDRGDLGAEVGFLLCCCRLVEAEERRCVGAGRGGEGTGGHAEGAYGGEGDEGAGGDAGVGGAGAESTRRGTEHSRMRERESGEGKCGVRVGLRDVTRQGLACDFGGLWIEGLEVYASEGLLRKDLGRRPSRDCSDGRLRGFSAGGRGPEENGRGVEQGTHECLLSDPGEREKEKGETRPASLTAFRGSGSASSAGGVSGGLESKNRLPTLF